MTYYLSYHELLNLDPPPLEIPGKRVEFCETVLFMIWASQHRDSLSNVSFGSEGSCWWDTALRAWQCFPELIERGDPGGG